MNKKNRISHILDSILVILFILLIVFIWFKNDEFLWLKIIVTAMSTITILFYIIIEHMINDDFENNQELIKLFMMKNDVTKSNKCTIKKGKKEISVQIEHNNIEIKENTVDSEKEILKNILKELKKIQEELNKWEKKK